MEGESPWGILNLFPVLGILEEGCGREEEWRKKEEVEKESTIFYLEQFAHLY